MYRFVLILLIFAATTLSAQQQVSVDAVSVPLLATDKNGKVVKDLKTQDISIFENGIRQSVIDILSPGKISSEKLSEPGIPLSVAFALDTSSSMASTFMNESRINIAKNAILMLMEALNNEDQMTLAPFARFPKALPPMTNNRQLIEDQLLLQKPRDSRTAIYDSLSEVVDGLTQVTGRKILVLCTDGEDNASRMSLNSLLEKLGASDILVLAFTIPSAEQMKSQYVIEKIANITGGFAFFPTTTQELQQIVKQLRATMQNQYSIWYRPSNTEKDGNWRDIQVLCHRPGIEIHHRPGYYAR